MENAVRYNREDSGWIKVATHTEADGRAALTVSNTDPLVPPYEVQHLFEPFRRLGTERLATASKGAGLGLSIVRAIATAHGSEVTAEAHVEGGLLVTATLPPPGRHAGQASTVGHRPTQQRHFRRAND